MDSLALPKTVTFKENEGKIEDVDAIVKSLIRGQQRRKTKSASASASNSASNATANGPDMKDLAREGVHHVEPFIYNRKDTKQTFRCHACGLLCRDTVPLLYPISLEQGRDLIGHKECLYSYGLQKRGLPRDNGLITLVQLRGLKLEPVESAFVFRSLVNRPHGETQDSYVSS